MMTKANKIGFVIGLLLVIIGFPLEFIMGNILTGGIMIAIGGFLILFSLLFQKKYKGSKL